MGRREPYVDYRPLRSKSPSASGRHRKRTPTPPMRSWNEPQRRRSRSRTPPLSSHSYQKSPKHRTPPPRNYRSRSRTPPQKRRSPMRSRSSRSPRDESRNRSNSSVMLDNNKYSSTSFAAELMKQKMFKKKTPQSVTSMEAPTSSTSTPTAHSFNSSKSYPPSFQMTETDGSFQPHNGFMTQKSATLPPLPLPVIQSSKPNQSPMKTSQSRLPMPPQCGTAISQLPLPSTSPVIDMDEDDTPHHKSLKTVNRPKIVGKTQLPQQQPQLNPRCVDVFDIISQIGEGTYGQVYKAKDTDNT